MGWGSFPSPPLLFFPCLECSGGGVQRLSWGIRCRLWAICPGLGQWGASWWGRVEFAPAGAADRGQGRALHFLHCCPWQHLLSPHPGPQPRDPAFLARACSLQPSLSFSLFLLLSRWPLGGRWMSGVYTLHGRAGGGASLVGVGLLSACGHVPACGLWLPWLPPSFPSLCPHPQPV